MTNKEVPYSEMAKYYDLIYTWKDYKKEAQKIITLIKKYKKVSKDSTLLEVACGTGKHLNYLKNEFICEGTDLSKDMIKLANENIKGVNFFVSDMITLNTNKKYDVVTCLFSSIAYVKTYSNLKKTIDNFANLVNKDGIVLIEPWFTTKTYISGNPHLTTYDSNEIKIARTVLSQIKGNLSIMNMHYLIAEKGKKDTIHFIDKHEMGLFDEDKMIDYMINAGFKVKHLKKGLMGRGLFIEIKK